MMYQRPEIKMAKSKFEKLPLREHVKMEAYEDGKMYRSHGTTDVFVWVAYEDSDDAAGEWHRAPVKFND